MESISFKKLFITSWGIGAGLAVLTLTGTLCYISGLSANAANVVWFVPDRLAPGSNASLSMRVENGYSGKPIAGADVNVALETPGRQPVFNLGSFKTGTDGSIGGAIAVPDIPEGEYLLRIRVSSDSGDDRIEKKVFLKRSCKLVLSTDKPLYQPSQTIHIKAVALDNISSLPANRTKIAFELEDSKGNKMQKKAVVTSEYGIASTDFVLADEINLGEYRLKATAGSDTVEQAIAIEKYNLPKFEISITADAAFYRPNNSLNGTIRAKYLFGKPLASADAKIEFLLPAQKSNMLKILPMKTGIDGTADFTVSFDENSLGMYDLQDTVIAINAVITDSAGQTESKMLTLPVSKNAVKLSIVPESNILVPGIANFIYLLANYPDGSPASANITIESKRAGIRKTSVRTGQSGVAKIEITPDWNIRSSYPCELTASAVDSQGNTGEASFSMPSSSRDETGYDVMRQALEYSHYRTAWNPSSGTVIDYSDFLLRPGKTVYKPGETLNAVILSPEENGTYYIDLIKNGQNVLSKNINAEDKLTGFSLALPENIRGLAILSASRITDSGIVLRNTRAVYIEPASELSIKTSADKDTYKPGETVRLLLQANMPNGRPAIAALGLSIIDESVFTLQQNVRRASFFPAMPVNGDEQERQLLTAAHLATIKSAPICSEAGFSFHARKNEMDSFKSKTRDRIAVMFYAFIAINAAMLIVLLAIHAKKVFVSLFIFALVAGVLASIAIPSLISSKMSAQETSLASRAAIYLNTDNGVVNAAQNQFRVREYFPETLYWNPQIITDENGRVEIEIPLADSITAWRATIDGMAATGQSGNAIQNIQVFQDFFVELNLPRLLTQNDEISVPVIVYNYTAQEQEIMLSIQPDEWFELLDVPEKNTAVPANEAVPVYFRIKARLFGTKNLIVRAKSASGMEDAVRKTIEILPDGQETQIAFNDRLTRTVNQQIIIPENALDGASVITAKIYPGTFSHIIDGLESMVKLPHGCFEQTSSTTYPNVMIYDYLKHAQKLTPEIEAQLENAISLGYQKLLSFEVSGGGFSLFGNFPASEHLTAYGILELSDMKKIYPVDERIIARSRKWLRQMQNDNGSWGNSFSRTAYTAWALAESGTRDACIDKAINYLKSRDFPAMDAYELALCTNALTAHNPGNESSKECLNRIEKTAAQDNDTASWHSEMPTLFQGMGKNADIETTALAAYALTKGNGNPQIIGKALTWLIRQRDPEGGWYSTQTTILVIRALIAGFSTQFPQEQNLSIAIMANEQLIETLKIDKTNYDLVRQIYIRNGLKKGANSIQIIPDKETNLAYQISAEFYLPSLKKEPEINEKNFLKLSVCYENTILKANEETDCRISLRYDSYGDPGMIIVDAGLPPGFVPVQESLNALIKEHIAEKYTVTDSHVIFYIGGMAERRNLEFILRIKASCSAKVRTAPSRAYEYYNPDIFSATEPVELEVKQD